MAHEQHLPETTEVSDGFNRPPLVECTDCGLPSHACGRLIELKTGDVWPARDTGFRMGGAR